MAQIPRPPKQGNVTSYVAKVAAGYSRILAGEVDADLDTIYGAWNGGVDTVNIRDGSVTSAKLAADAVGSRELASPSVAAEHIFDGQVITSKLPDGAVTDAKILSVAWAKVTGAPAAAWGVAGGDLSGSYPNPAIRAGAVTTAKLAPGAVGSAQIAAGAVGSSQLADGGVATADLADYAISTQKIAVGHGLHSRGYHHRTDTLACTALDNEQLYLEYTWISRGGYFLVVAALHVTFGVDASGGAFASNLRLDGTPGLATDGAVQDLQWYQGATSATGTTIVPGTLVTGYIGNALAAGTHRIKVTGKSINRFVGYAHIDSGWGCVVEFA